MSLSDNIISGAILLIVLIATGAIIVSQSVETTRERLDFRQTSYLLDKHEGSLNTIMTITEPETRQSYARLLARSIYENHDVIDLPSGGEVNISDLIVEALNMVFGEGNYYAQIRPFISDVHIRLVFDGTGSLEVEREILRQRMEEIIGDTREIAARQFGTTSTPAITFRIFIVSNDDSLCDPFETLTVEGFAGCETVSKHVAYQSIEEPNLGFTPNTIYGPSGNEVYYEGDWAAGVATSILDLIEGEQPIDYAESLIIIFPITDELTTGSIPDECYASGAPLRPSGATGDDALGWNAGYCGFCNADCPLERSSAQIEQLHALIEGYDALDERIVISAVFSKDCGTPYQTGYNNPPNFVRTAGYIDQYIDNGVYDAPAGSTYCDFENCAGCRTNANDATRICWRSSCTDDTINQLSELSERYRGSLINLTEVEQLPDEIIKSVQNAADALVTSYGEKREDDSRYVATYSILLPNNERVPFTVWIYEDRAFDIHVPQITLRAEPPAAWPGQPIRIISEIETTGGVARVRVTLEPETEPLELELLRLVPRTYTIDYDTTGLSDGFYGIAYEVHDTSFNRFEGMQENVFEIDTNLRPYPTLINTNVILQDTVLAERNVDVIVGFENDPDASTPERVWVEITAENGERVVYELTRTGSIWTTQFAASSQEGTYTVSVLIEDDLGRSSTYTSIDQFEVVERIECTSRAICIEQGAGLTACTGESKNDYFCSENRAAQGMFAAEQQSCQSGLGWDSNTHECYEPTTTYDFVFVPLGYPNTAAGRTAFTNAVTIITRGLKELSPMNECSADMRSTIFKFHLAQDYTCATSQGCTSSNPNSCLSATINCGESAFPGVGDRFFGISPTSWGSLQGQAAGFGSINMITSEQHTSILTRNVALHEAGHTWHLGHLRTGVPTNGGPCRPEYPNRADCNEPNEVRFLMNYDLARSDKQFGPAGYSFIRNYHLADLMGYCS